MSQTTVLLVSPARTVVALPSPQVWPGVGTRNAGSLDFLGDERRSSQLGRGEWSSVQEPWGLGASWGLRGGFCVESIPRRGPVGGVLLTHTLARLQQPLEKLLIGLAA